MRYLAIASLLLVIALPALAEGTPDPIESRLVNQAQAAQTQNQNFLEAVKALIETREAERTYWKAYVAGLKENAK